MSRGNRWAGAGYRSSTALALVGDTGEVTEELEVIEAPEAEKDDPQLPPPPPPPSAARHDLRGLQGS